MKRNRQIRLWLTALAAVVMMTLAGCQKTQKVESILTDEETETSQFGGGENLSAIKKNCIKGLAHYQHNEMEPAVNYFSRVIAVKDVPAEDFDSYIQAGVLLMDIYADQYDNEGALRTAMLLIDKLNGAEGERLNELKSIYTTIGRCQLRLNREAEAEESFKKASEYVKRLVGKEKASAIDIYNGYVSYSQIVTDYFNANKIVESEPWLDLAELLFGVYKTMPGADPSEIDLLHSDILLNHAMIAVTKGEKEKAARYFDAYKATESSQTVAGRINGSEYLAKAHRYAESADALTCLDELLSNSHMTIDFEVIKTLLLPKLNVNYQAGRKDSALRVAMQIYDVFDSAYTQQKKSEAAKLATIYDTEGKERRIAEQQAEISQQRVIGLVIAIILLTIFFVIYTLLRRRAAKRLAEMKAAQERIESELRIARDIQMSMVPSVFPEREGLDMYASMTPAKEVGGDLYGYLLEGDKLYFALGDVSGKGVPAAMFMMMALTRR
jgi:tetratricopeptide (TPR) repeat protein